MIRMVAPGHAGEYLAGLRELVLLTLDSVVPAVLGDAPELADEAARFAAQVGSATTADELRRIAARLRKFAYRLEMAAGERAEVRAGLLDLFRLLLENIDQIVVDDRWLHGQIEALREVIDQPASVRLIDDAERRLKAVIYKQSQLKHNLSEAQRNLQAMLAGFVDQLALFAETTGTYHDTISVCAQKIGAARDITAIGHLLDEVMRETRSIQAHAQRSRDDLQATRRRAAGAEARIAELQQALEEASRQMRHDPLTGVLNRRGLEEAFAKEAARALRRHAPLAVALLDLDHFKTLNDTWGDQTGDDALVHLTGVVSQNLRPQDSIARHGGEEFILLYPETELPEATAALVRLQRELTRAFFLAGDTRILITFSAGVTAWQAGEDLETVLERAGAAMHEAVKSGKNKVVSAGADSAHAK
jgi:diguanylate cyclase